MKEKQMLAKMNSFFNNKTLKYRINGFAHACKMDDIDVTSNIVVNGSDNFGVLFSSKKNKKNNDCPDYYITVSTNKGDYRGKAIDLNGYYDDLNFSFINYHNFKDNLNRKICEIPFCINLTKTIDKDTYILHTETINGMETKFSITKSREYKDKTITSNMTFYANVLDFSQILKLVKSFVYNPKLVFTTYNEVINSKKIVLNNNDINRGIMQDKSLDKPIGKIKKKIKSIIG